MPTSWVAGSAQDHRADRLASSLGNVGVGLRVVCSSSSRDIEAVDLLLKPSLSEGHEVGVIVEKTRRCVSQGGEQWLEAVG